MPNVLSKEDILMELEMIAHAAGEAGMGKRYDPSMCSSKLMTMKERFDRMQEVYFRVQRLRKDIEKAP